MNGLIDDSQYVLKDEGYQSASTSKQFENELLKLEEYYMQQSTGSDFQLKLQHELKFQHEPKFQHELVEKRVYIKELISFDDYDDIDDEDDEEEEEEYAIGKGKGGKRYVKKTCHSEEEQQQLKLKEQYLSKIKNKKKYLRFQQLDDETQLVICKIDALRESGGDKSFYDKLLRILEGRSLKVTKLKKTVEKMKELEDNNARTIDDIIDEHQRILYQKDQEIKHLKKKLEAEKRMRGRFIKKSEKRFKKHLKIEDLEEEYQIIIANMEALRKSDSVVYNEVRNILEELSYFM